MRWLPAAVIVVGLIAGLVLLLDGHSGSMVHKGHGGHGVHSSSDVHRTAASRRGVAVREPSLTARECWQNPGVSGEGTGRIEACGYPGFDNTGVEKGVTLTPESGVIHFTSTGWENQTTREVHTGDFAYEGRKLKGTITVAWNAKNITIRNDEIFTEGECDGELCPVNSIEFERRGTEGGHLGEEAADEAAKGTNLISHVRVGGTAIRGVNVVQTCIDSPWRGPYIAEYVKAVYCGGFKINGGGELNHDYCPANFEISGEHYECITDQGILGSTVPLVIRNSTVFQPPPANQNEGSSSKAGMTAAIFLQGYSGSVQKVTEEKNFLAGGAYTLYGGEEVGHVKLTGPVIVTDNRFARCLKTSRCPDSHGYFERIGYYGIMGGSFNPSLTTWSHNFFDHNRANVPFE